MERLVNPSLRWILSQAGRGSSRMYKVQKFRHASGQTRCADPGYYRPNQVIGINGCPYSCKSCIPKFFIFSVLFRLHSIVIISDMVH